MPLRSRTFSQPLILASRSPRRKQMLEEAGFQVQVQPPDFDDGQLQRGRVSALDWVVGLSFLKAWRVADMVRGMGGQLALWCEPWASLGMTATVIGADTMCVADDVALGQPRDAADAQRMLRLLKNRAHQTITGVSLIDLRSGRRLMFHDAATVRVGNLRQEQIDAYIASGEWRGKAGAYNLSERIHAGWPIECVGDPTTVMGLPMQRLQLVRAGAER